VAVDPLVEKNSRSIHLPGRRDMDDVVNRSSVPAEPARTDALTSTYWQARYDEGRTGWDRGGPSPMLGIWLEAEILRPCRILIPGCGRGHEAVALAARGFDVTAVDFAEAAVHNLQTTLREKQLEAVVTQADLLEFTPPNPSLRSVRHAASLFRDRRLAVAPGSPPDRPPHGPARIGLCDSKNTNPKPRVSRWISSIFPQGRESPKSA